MHANHPYLPPLTKAEFGGFQDGVDDINFPITAQDCENPGFF